MPLVLNTEAQTRRPIIVTWDPSNMAQFDEASGQVSDLLSQGYKYDRKPVATDGEARLIPPARDPFKGCFRILCADGDKRVTWDRREAAQVDDARTMFNDLIASGHTAFATRSDGTKGSRIEEFDSVLEEIIMVPKTVAG
jgi:hypothetical protein